MDNIKFNLIDVGCADYLVSPWINNIDSIQCVLGIDPFGVQSYSKFLKKNKTENHIYKCAISDIYRKKHFFVCDKKQCSSFYKPNKEIINYYRKNNRDINN